MHGAEWHKMKRKVYVGNRLLRALKTMVTNLDLILRAMENHGKVLSYIITQSPLKILKHRYSLIVENELGRARVEEET